MEIPFKKLIYLVEREQGVASTFAGSLVENDYEVSIFARDTEVLQVLRQTPPDLVILEIRPGVDSLGALKAIRIQSDCPVLLLSTSSAEADCIDGLELGGDDYVVKPVSVRELVARVKALFRRADGQVLSGRPQRRGLKYRDLYLDLSSKTLCCGTEQLALTPSEFFILNLMMAAPSQIFQREQLLRASTGDSRTVDMHIANLRKKVAQLDPSLPCLQAIRGVGYRFAMSSEANPRLMRWREMVTNRET